MIFETKRLLLRAWTLEDAKDLYEYAKDPRVGPACGWTAHHDIEESRAILQTILSKEGNYALYLKEEKKVIGCISLMIGENCPLSLKADEGELGCWIGVPFWGKGLMSEAMKTLVDYAFEELKLKKICCSYVEGNERSKGLQEKCGFQYKYSKEKEYPLLQQRRKIHINSLTREEWEKRRLVLW